MASKQLNGFKLSDGTIIGEYQLSQLIPSLNADNTLKNYQITSPKNINVEPSKSIKIKPGSELDGSSWKDGQIELLPDHTSDLREVVVKAWRSIEVDSDGKTPVGGVQGTNTDLGDEMLVRLKTYCEELELNSYDKVNKSKKNLKLKFKNKDAWQKGVIEGASHDIRAYSTGAGTGGGIAIQIAACDSNYKENKFKIETDRKKDVSDTTVATKTTFGDYYTGEGGKGIEIGTINSQFESLFTRTMRRGLHTKLFATTRSDVKMFNASGAVTTDATAAEKWDYETQSDDTKDIIAANHPDVEWIDLINAAAYLKAQNLIPSDGSFYSA